MAAARQFHFVDGVIRGMDSDSNAKMLKKFRETSVEEIKKVMKDVLLPAFLPGKAYIVVTLCPDYGGSRFTHLIFLPISVGHNTDSSQNLVKAFTESGFKTQSQSLSHFQADYGLAADEDEAEAESEKDDDAEIGSFAFGEEDD